MIIIAGKYLSAEHIEYVDIEPLNDQLYTVIVKMTGCTVVFGKGKSDVMDRKMAVELWRRIIQAIVNYKSQQHPLIQSVNFPTYQEVHPESESEKS